jgi:hypothetical protein
MELHANTQSHIQLIIYQVVVFTRHKSRSIYKHLLCSQTNEGTSNSFAWYRPKIYTVKYKAEIETHISG